MPDTSPLNKSKFDMLREVEKEIQNMGLRTNKGPKLDQDSFNYINSDLAETNLLRFDPGDLFDMEKAPWLDEDIKPNGSSCAI